MATKENHLQRIHRSVQILAGHMHRLHSRQFHYKAAKTEKLCFQVNYKNYKNEGDHIHGQMLTYLQQIHVS